jgi:beta-mannosidase
MTYLPETFHPLHDSWTLTAARLADDAPESASAPLSDGILAVVPGETHLDLRRADLIEDPFDGDNETVQQWIGDTDWRYTTSFTWSPRHVAGRREHRRRHVRRPRQ